MIIDMRLRPPYKSITNMSFFQVPQYIAPTVLKNGGHMPLSCFEKSMDLLIQEMDEASVDMGVVPVRTADGVLNDDVIGLLEDYPGRFIVMAGIDPTTGILNALNDIDKICSKRPLGGYCNGTTILQEWSIACR